MVEPDEEIGVRKLNKVFHAEQAAVYDDNHDIHHLAAALFKMQVGETDRVLDIGTGTGFVRQIVPSENIIGLDISRPMLEEETKDESTLIEAVAGYIPIAANSVDVITGRSVLHHFPNLDRVASECYRVLRPDGKIVIANEPQRMGVVHRLSQRARSRIGFLLGKQSSWKHEIAERFQTHVWDLTQTVNYHEETGIDPQPFDDRFVRVARVEYGEDRLAFIWRNE